MSSSTWTMVIGLVVLVLGLIIMLAQELDRRRRGHGSMWDPGDAGDLLDRVVKLIKRNGIGVVTAAAGIVLLLIGAVASLTSNNDEDDDKATPSASLIIPPTAAIVPALTIISD